MNSPVNACQKFLYDPANKHKEQFRAGAKLSKRAFSIIFFNVLITSKYKNLKQKLTRKLLMA